MSRFLGNQVATYRPQMSPERSIYDLYKVVFAKSSVMLKEHFRCVAPIIEYSKREFYNHELRPLRLPKASERLDPPLVDVVVQDGYRRGDVNLAEALFIVDEIKAIVTDPKMARRSIGVVSLLADKQALAIWERLADEIGPELMQRHSLACGDARTFQGKERDIMFLSMVSAPNDVGAPLSRDTFAQRFNVAASRARDRMYLVRSVELEHLSEADRFRRSLIQHFSAPFTQHETRVEDLRKLCESDFEREIYDELTQRGYWVTPQVRVGKYRIDLVIEGHDDARLGVECDGDKYHGADKWADDMQRQRVLERAGWMFWRCFASAFIRRRKDVLADLLKTLAERGIEPIGAEGAPRSVHTDRRLVSTVVERSQGPLKPSEVDGDGQAASLAVTTPSSSTREDVPSAEATRLSPIAEDSLGGRNQVMASVAPLENSLSSSENSAIIPDRSKKDPRSEYGIPADGSPAHENSRSSALNRNYGNRKATGNPVVEGLAGLEERFRKPQCSQCSRVARINIYTRGPVIVCTDLGCNKVEPIDMQTLQRLAKNLRFSCRNCRAAGLISLNGPLGNYLKCVDCGENTSWQFVAGYLF
jgi:very-short-patch-repair endonuclease